MFGIIRNIGEGGIGGGRRRIRRGGGGGGRVTMIIWHPNDIPRRGAQITIEKIGRVRIGMSAVYACPPNEKFSRKAATKLEEPRNSSMGFLNGQKVIAIGKRP